MKLNLTLIFIIFGLLYSYGQNSSKQASPSADFSNTFNPGADLFTGKIDVSVDLVNLKFAGEDLSVRLNYLAGNGIKVDELPSWAGSGWGLNTPGYIYRVVKGKPDELQTYKSELTTLSESFGDPAYYGSSSVSVINKTLNTTLHPQNKNYLTNYALLNSSDWNSTAKITGYKPSGLTNTSGSTGWSNQGTIFRKTDYSTTNIAPVTDLAPDDFIVQIGELNGVFFKDITGAWSFISNNNLSCKVEVFIDDYYMTSTMRTPGVINKIVLTSSKGIKYTFDGEFESSNVSTAAVGYNFPPGGNYFYDVLPTLWNISKIENLNTQEQISFSYSPSFYQVSKFNSAFGTSSSIVYDNSINITSRDQNDWRSYNANYKVVHRVKKLEAITCSNGYRIKFDSSLSNQLLTNDVISSGAEFSHDPILYDELLKYNLYKLNSISIYDDNTLIKQVKFKFNEKVTERLQLKKIEFSDGTNVYDSFSFNYNQTKLPPYGSRQTDHWGYYNGLDFFATYKSSPYSDPVLTSFKNYKIQDANLCKAEMLESVVSARGGRTLFTYEPNDYYVQVNDVTRQLVAIEGPDHGGGVRIKNITTTDNEKELFSKTYYYIKEDGSSSGILAVPPAQYLTPNGANSSGGTYSFKVAGYSTNISNSSNVTYSRVTEKIQNSITTINEFTNFDNGFSDQDSQLKNYTGTIFDIKNAFQDFSFKRGKLKSVKKISNNQTLPVEETIFRYQHDFSDSSFPDYRAIYMSNTTPTFYYSALSYKRYPDLLREVKNIINEKSGSIVSTKEYKYDSYNNLIEETAETSKVGGVSKTVYKYPYDFSSGVYQQMVYRNLLTPVIEQVSSVDNKQTLFSRTNYDLYTLNNILLPKSIEVQVGAGPLQTKTYFNRYDISGNILEKQTADAALKEVYLWGYKAQYPVAKIVGSDYASVEATLGGSDAVQTFSNASNPDKIALDAFLAPLKSNLPSAQIISYTYKPLVGITSMTDIKGMSIYYEYDGFQRLGYIRDQYKNIIKSYCYNYAGQTVDCNNLSIPLRPLIIKIISE